MTKDKQDADNLRSDARSDTATMPAEPAGGRLYHCAVQGTPEEAMGMWDNALPDEPVPMKLPVSRREKRRNQTRLEADRPGRHR